MASIYKSLQVQNSRPAVTASQSGQSFSVRGAYPVGGYTSGSAPVLNPGGAANPLVVNDVISLVKWPANTVINDITLDLDVIDNTATPLAILQVGVLNAAQTALAGPVILALTAAQAKSGGVFSPGAGGSSAATDVRYTRFQPKSVDRYLGVLVQTGPGATAISQATAASTVNNRGFWQAATAYALNDYLLLPNGQIVYVTTAGTSGTTVPEWASVKADTTTDGSATWTAAAPVIGLRVEFRPANFGG